MLKFMGRWFYNLRILIDFKFASYQFMLDCSSFGYPELGFLSLNDEFSSHFRKCISRVELCFSKFCKTAEGIGLCKVRPVALVDRDRSRSRPVEPPYRDRSRFTERLPFGFQHPFSIPVKFWVILHQFYTLNYGKKRFSSNIFKIPISNVYIYQSCLSTPLGIKYFQMRLNQSLPHCLCFRVVSFIHFNSLISIHAPGFPGRDSRLSILIHTCLITCYK